MRVTPTGQSRARPLDRPPGAARIRCTYTIGCVESTRFAPLRACHSRLGFDCARERDATLEQDVSFSGGLKHLARWYGVSRKPTLQGPGEGVSAGFDWNKPAKAASLWVSIYNMELKRLFISRGGLDATEAIDSRSSSGRFIRRRNMLENEDHIREGIELAFHPFIEMVAWPGNP